MKTITEYLQKGHIINNIDLTDLFVNGDAIKRSNYEDYIKIRDSGCHKVIYIKRKDLLNVNFNDIFKTLQKMFLEYGKHIFICTPLKFSNSSFVTCCDISLMTKEVDLYDHVNNDTEIINYFRKK